MLAAPTLAAPTAQDAATFEAVRSADLKLAVIGWRLASANAPLCDQHEAGTGMQLHTLDQFDSAHRAAAKAHFGFASEVAIEGVVPGTPAEAAGLRADDSLIRAGTVSMAALAGKPGTTDRLVAAQNAIATLSLDRPIDMEIIRKGVPLRVTLQPLPVCKSRFELRIASDYGASADGSMVQISSQFVENYPDDEVAAVVAHEFSHNVLRHRDRLEAAGVTWGLLAGFGGNVKYFRQTEVEADLLSVYILNNAEVPVRSSIAFWRRFGPSKAGGIFRARTHPAWRDRIATIEAEIAKIEPISTRPIVPKLIELREQPLIGDWQSILIRAH